MQGARGLLTGALKRHWGRVLFGVLLLSAHQAAEAAVPVAIGLVIDRAVATGDWVALGWSVVGLAALFGVLASAWRFGSRQSVLAYERETHHLRVEVAKRVLDPRGHRTGMRSGELLSVASSDAERAAMFIRAVSMGIAALAALVVSSVALLAIDIPLGLGVLVGVPLLVLLTTRVAPLLTRHSAAQQEAAARTTALATDLVGGLRTLRGIGAQHTAASRYRKSSTQALQASLRTAATTGLYQGVTAATSGLFLAAVAGFAGWFALTGRLTVGELVTVIGLAQFISEPLRTLGFCGQLTATARASAARLATVLSAEPQVGHGSREVPNGEISVALQGVSYRTLNSVDVDLAPGELLGVVAYDQRDTDALLAVLAGQVADHDGKVLLDGIPAEELHIDARRRAILVEQHDVALFEGSLRENLSAGSQLTDDELAAAVAAAAAEDVVDVHPSGLDHPVTDRGSSLSGGQRQRIGLARALLAAPPVLVLHDPTTAVDAVTEELIAERLTAARAGRSTVVVTSSPALLGKADRVVVLKDGHVTSIGTHAELAESDETYRKAVLR
ncbi:putative ABC transport system ATP-binding protein [Kibdelosporangium banguiense]|uniref:ABC transport system ATP-binding protein n=1 Tax=Kibdelosporangium banguiense TaxID=1365924 RepID=A0ABS4TMQ0_9PSEU|nr:ABC transporter ATP-binding protein [Kibdelosporangium banguiense]MBP2325166.1 putative ABC transport system ATP-binding protein [Kibdelosporangium banguiense]